MVSRRREPGPLAERLTRAFGQAALSHAVLTEAPGDCVRALRESGASLQSVIAEVRELVARVLSDPTAGAGDVLVERIVDWCIEEYHRAS